MSTVPQRFEAGNMALMASSESFEAGRIFPIPSNIMRDEGIGFEGVGEGLKNETRNIDHGCATYDSEVEQTRSDIVEEFTRVIWGDLSRTTEYGSDSVGRALRRAEKNLGQDVDLVITGNLLGGGGPFIAGVFSMMDQHFALSSAYKVIRTMGSGAGTFFAAAIILGVDTEKLLRMHFAFFHLQQNHNITKLEDLLYAAMSSLFPPEAYKRATDRLFIRLYTKPFRARLVSTYFSQEDLMSTVVAATVGTFRRPFKWRRGSWVFGSGLLTPVFEDGLRDQLIIQPTNSYRTFCCSSFEEEVKAGQESAVDFLRGSCSRGLSMLRTGEKVLPSFYHTRWLLSQSLRRTLRGRIIQGLVFLWLISKVWKKGPRAFISRPFLTKLVLMSSLAVKVF